MINLYLEYEIARQRFKDLEREIEHRRLVKEFERANKTQSRQRKVTIGMSSLILVVIVAVQFLAVN